MPRRRRARKTTRRSGVRRRLSSIRKSKKTQFLGRSAKNVAIGSGLINVTTRLIGRQTAQAGVYALPLNLVIAGTVGSAMGAGQKDLVSTGVKIAGSRFITTQLEPRLSGMTNRGIGRNTGNGAYT
jgi:hypothetical protein